MGVSRRMVPTRRSVKISSWYSDAGSTFSSLVVCSGVVALLVHAVLVAAAGPRALESALRALALVPVHESAGRPANLQLAQFARPSDRVALVVDQPHLVSRHRLAGRAIPYFARTVGEEDVQHLGRADAVEDLDAGALGPAPADVRWQRFACRGADS